MRSRIDPAPIEAVILCGGKGERLREVVNDRPKPLAQIGSRPFLDVLIDYVAGYGFRKFILLAGYMGELVEQYALQKTKSSPLDLKCLVEPAPLGTGGAVKNAAAVLTGPRFLLLNGDSLCRADLAGLLTFHCQKQALATMMLSRVEQVADYGLVLLDDDNRIANFTEKSTGVTSGLVNAGVYLLEKAVLQHLPPNTPCSLERDIFPKMIGSGFYGYIVPECHLDIGTPGRYQEAKKVLPR